MVGVAIDCHGYGWVMIFEAGKENAPNFASTEVAIIDLMREAQVNAFYIVGEPCGAGA